MNSGISGDLHVDFSLLFAGRDYLKVAKKEIFADIDDNLKENIDKLLEYGRKHDSCFSRVSRTEIDKEVKSESDDFEDLIAKFDFVADLCINYSNYTDSQIFEMLGAHITNKDSLASNLISGFYDYSKTLSEKINRELITEDFDYEYYSKILNAIINDPKKTTREKAAAAGIFLTTIFPHMDYFWGGGHGDTTVGVNPDWGKPRKVTAEGSKSTGRTRSYALDCSGFTSWALRTAGLPGPDSTEVDNSFYQYGTTVPITSSGIQPGDVAHQNGHVGLVVAVNGDNIIIAHSTGDSLSAPGDSGMALTEISTKTGKVVDDTFYGPGGTSFTEIIKINYPDDNKNE